MSDDTCACGRPFDNPDLYDPHPTSWDGVCSRCFQRRKDGRPFGLAIHPDTARHRCRLCGYPVDAEGQRCARCTRGFGTTYELGADPRHEGGILELPEEMRAAIHRRG